MRGVFTPDERAVVFFLAGALLVGALVTGMRRVEVPPPDASACAGDTVGCMIELNAAEPELLEELPGIGPVRAREIVRLREERGGFRSVDDLIDVRGIGPVTLERVRPHVVVTDSVRPAPGRDGP
ncbi:MAG: hypothetical protein GF405_03795 [Candidatus Eisenbacteria bacterium]|nr:hypothetical protein [Candidatus Eisenbacteria bacterium]